jgi:serine/threonine protein kinase
MIGRLLTGRYLILKQLGAGGFSETYLAIDKYLLDQPACVVKWLRPSPRSTISIEKAQQLFETEARVLDRLGRHHTQIPTLFAYCHEQDQVYLIQDYIKGENLESWFTQGHCLSSDAAIILLRKILPTLQYVHHHDVIHRDVKPSNLICREDGDIALIDFGAACDQIETRKKRDLNKRDEVLIGTVGYMPDEQQKGCSQFNSDLYALGITVIQLLTGVHPQQLQIDPTTGELNWQIYLTQSSIEPRLIMILNQMTKRDHRLRYQHATEVMAVLEPLSTIEKSSGQQAAKPAKDKAKSKVFLERIWKPILVLLSITAVCGGYYLSSTDSKQSEALMAQMESASSQINYFSCRYLVCLQQKQLDRR